MSGVEERLQVIEERNMRVGADKAWETSWTRRGLIAGVTYICAVMILNVLGNDSAWENALIPVMGYVVSTLSLPPLKEVWIKHRIKKERQ
ncbi:MAG: hypothetical protein SFW62_08785 [Alphaproteobacteria bacterium]|nr:hypothetical protein [Alphaproteobacteria bacterium]